MLAEHVEDTKEGEEVKEHLLPYITSELVEPYPKVIDKKPKGSGSPRPLLAAAKRMQKKRKILK